MTTTFYNTLLTPVRLIVISLLLNLSLPLQAQSSSKEQQWYQVEVFIFANSGSGNNELWPENLGLKYPEPIINLKQLTDDTNPSGDSTTPQDSAAEQAFVLLDPTQHLLTRAVKKIQTQPHFRQLFHGAWRQTIANRSQSNNILIRGGDAYDQHFELEGSIKLSVERYLHIKTDLWLSSFVNNTGSDQQLWPVLPQLPSHLSPAFKQKDAIFSASSQETSLNFSNTANNSLETSLEQSLQTPFNSMVNPFLSLRNNQYSVQQTVVMRQNRRMRSNELHYIDHPMMGLLVKVIPYNPSEQLTKTTH